MPLPLTVSIVIPAFNAARYLESCLTALKASALQPFECIVVDDGSTDDSSRVATRFGAKVLSTGGRRGPACARNLGAKAASGEILFFIDSDVCVHEDTLQRIVVDFSEEPGLDALMGSYDNSPQATEFLSVYRNLMHSFVHQNARREASSFWSGCGAIKRSVFLKHNGFDDRYGRPAIEDIELGYRLTGAGHRLLLDRDVQVKHLKKWTFWNILKTDIFDRAIPWTELILRERRMPNDLNVQLSQRISVALASLLFGMAAAGALYYKGFFLIPVLSIIFFLLACYWVEVAPLGLGKRILLLGAVSGFTWLAYDNHMISLIPPVLLGYLLLFLRHRYTSSKVQWRRITGVGYAVYLILALIFMVAYLPVKLPVLIFYLITLAVVMLNIQFYLFLGSRMGWLTMIAVIPFHLLYHFYSGASFLAGVAKHTWKHSVKPRELFSEKRQ
jgi:glycosyltransferase involved in cell wall biosynthesis